MTAQQQQQGRQELNIPNSSIMITQQQKKARVQKGRKKLLKSKKFFKPHNTHQKD